MASPLARGAEPDQPAGGRTMASPLARGAERSGVGRAREGGGVWMDVVSTFPYLGRP